jgi:hypothetical protein
MKTLPDNFLILTHEGLHKVSTVIEAVQSMDHLLAKFSSEKLVVAKNISEHPFGMIHEAIWTGEPQRFMTILELTKGSMVLDTQYRGHTNSKEESWVSPCFGKSEGSFSLRCAFEFEKWTQAGLKLFLALNFQQAVVYFWVYYQGQIYHVPFGNIFEGTEQICLGHNAKQHTDIFHVPQSRATALSKAIMLLSASVWNHDTFHAARNLPILTSLVRFNSDPDKLDLPMMDPLDPVLIKKSVVATSRDLVLITTKIVPPIIQS